MIPYKIAAQNYKSLFKKLNWFSNFLCFISKGGKLHFLGFKNATKLFLSLPNPSSNNIPCKKTQTYLLDVSKINNKHDIIFLKTFWLIFQVKRYNKIKSKDNDHWLQMSDFLGIPGNFSWKTRKNNSFQHANKNENTFVRILVY